MTERIEIFKNHFFESLEELSDLDFQENVWANKNNPEGLVSSYTEAAIQFWDDALVKYALEAGAIIYDKNVTQALHELSDAVDSLDEDDRHTMEVINDPKMQIVRDKAAEVLGLIAISDKSENTVTFLEEGTLKILEP
jgi:hypothetical protein